MDNNQKLDDLKVNNNTTAEIVVRYFILFSGLILMFSSFFIGKACYFASHYFEWEIGQITTSKFQLFGNIVGAGTLLISLIFVGILVFPFLKESEPAKIKTLVIVNYVTLFILIMPLIAMIVYTLTIYFFTETLVGIVLLVIGGAMMLIFYQILLKQIKKQWQERKMIEYKIDQLKLEKFIK
ncbi:hypothetical protein [Spiroplasma endosymbiont of Amphibalanus improvisus]|uniref:hypothetical protein n=1 Tax=Spiroplasma endosymbiont of Amphibalanus improvisus TaxID=3066327 RepID=UPI00313E9E94